MIIISQKGSRAGSGLRHNHASTQAMQVHASTTVQRGASVSARKMLLKAIIAVAFHLDRRLTQLPLAQLRSMGPKRRWRQSHRYSAGELRAAAHADRRMKTVVGNPGTNTPTMPSTRHSNAKAFSNQRSGSGSGSSRGICVSEGLSAGEAMDGDCAWMQRRCARAMLASFHTHAVNCGS